MTNEIEAAILRTLAYADVFDYPLTEGEIWRYYIGKTSPKLADFKSALTQLKKLRHIGKLKDYYYLRSRLRIVDLRQVRARIYTVKLGYARRAAKVLSIIPTVWFVGLSGALALENAPDNDDIDLFIIVAPESLWTVRMLAIILLDSFGWRRRPGNKEITNKICLNMFLAGPRGFKPVEQNLYLAHEIAQLKPLINKRQTHEHFLQANMWLKEYLPHTTIVEAQSRHKRLPAVRLMSGLETICKHLQLKYMHKRRTCEVIRPHVLKFHPRDAREWVTGEYEKRLTKLGLKP